MDDYRVQLDSYSGPMDLLLYLIRRDEVDVYDIPISRVLEQYLGYVKLMEELDPDTAGEFLVMAATLMEIKSRLLLPRPPAEEGAEDLFDPRADLVRQLLAYRTFREAAHKLQEQADVHARRFPRPPVGLPADEGQVDLEDVQIWDLMTAFNKLLAAVGKQKATHDVVYDDTPIALHADDVLDRLQREGPVMDFSRIFEGRTRGEMVGLFLALLELIRQKRVRIQQERPFASIQVHLIDATPIATLTDAESQMQDPIRSIEGEDEADAAEEAFEEDPGTGPAEALFQDEEEEEDDEFSRRIRAVEIADVNLGRERPQDHPGEHPQDSPAERPPDAHPSDDTAEQGELHDA